MHQLIVRQLLKRDGAFAALTFAAMMGGNKAEVNLPDAVAEFLELSEGNLRMAIAMVAMIALRHVGRAFPWVDKVLNLGQQFPEKEIEHIGAEQLLQWDAIQQTIRAFEEDDDG